RTARQNATHSPALRSIDRATFAATEARGPPEAPAFLACSFDSPLQSGALAANDRDLSAVDRIAAPQMQGRSLRGLSHLSAFCGTQIHHSQPMLDASAPCAIAPGDLAA